MKNYNIEIEEEIEKIRKDLINEIRLKIQTEELTTIEIKILADAYKQLT